jgi:hypothetical protein
MSRPRLPRQGHSDRPLSQILEPNVTRGPGDAGEMLRECPERHVPSMMTDWMRGLSHEMNSATAIQGCVKV